MYAKMLFTLILSVILKYFHPVDLILIDINSNHVLGTLTPFWESTGFCPPDPHADAYKFFLSEDMKQNLAIIGSIPTHKPLQVRIHYLMNLIEIEKNLGHVDYNFKWMDDFINYVWRQKLTLGFELMGNPSGFFDNFDDEKQVFEWQNLVFATTDRYIKKYGIQYISQFNFESWNEPLIGHFDDINMTTNGFLNYYNASSIALQKQSPALKLGGPGGECHDPDSQKSFCWILLKYCNKRKARLDFISLHKKGSGFAKKIIELENATINIIYKLFPNLKQVEIQNNEADPLVGWSESLWWRADVTYAAIATKILDQHIQHYFLFKSPAKNVPFSLLSNDNAFMSYVPFNFNQRTLLARFQMNNTTPKHVQFVKKPIFVVMGLWHKLGNEMIETNINVIGNHSTNIGVIATKYFTIKEGNEIAVLIYNSNDTNPNEIGVSEIQVQIILPENGNSAQNGYKMICYSLDNEKTNPFRIWEISGKPSFPNISLFTEMKKQEEPAQIFPEASVFKHFVKIQLSLTMPSVTLIHLAQKPQPPKKILVVKFLKIFSNIVLITWDVLRNNKLILTYEIQYSKTRKGPFKRLNTENNIFASYQHSCNEVSKNCTVKGYYKVTALDYWNQRGPYSNISFYD